MSCFFVFVVEVSLLLYIFDVYQTSGTFILIKINLIENEISEIVSYFNIC